MVDDDKWVGTWVGNYTVKIVEFWEWFYTMHHFAPKALTGFGWSYTFSPLPYHTANGKTVATGIVILRADTRWVRIQGVTVCSRTSSRWPPVAICDACEDVAIRATVETRTEKVERFFWDSLLAFTPIRERITPIIFVSSTINNRMIVDFYVLIWALHG